MVISRLILALSLLATGTSFAESKRTPFEDVLTRTEHTNAGLLNGINYNVWWYRAFSLGTSWNGPENALSKINERADRSPKDAQELLLELSSILKNEEPAGDYILDIFEQLLKKSQIDNPMPTTVLQTVLLDRGWGTEVSSSGHFSDSDPINSKIINFISKDLKILKINLQHNSDLAMYMRLFHIYLKYGDQTDSGNLSKMVSLSISEGIDDHKVFVADRIFSIQPTQMYFSSSNSKLTDRAVLVLNLRKNLLEALPAERRKEIAIEKIKGYRLESNNYNSYFNYKKIEHDLFVLEQVGGREALLLVADKIKQIIDLVERVDKKISRHLTRVSLSIGYSSISTSSFVSSSYRNRTSTLSSRTVSDTLKSLRFLRDKSAAEAKSTIQIAIDICEAAVLKEDSAVLETCANDLITGWLTDASDPNTPKDLVAALNRAVRKVLSKTGDYFKPENFSTSCEEYDLEKALVDIQEDLKNIEGLKVRVPEYYNFKTAYNTSNSDVTHFMFADCSKSEYSMLVTPRNMTYSDWGEGTDLPNVFFVDSTTVASCISPYPGQLEKADSRYRHSRTFPNRIIAINNYINDVYSRYWETLGASRQFHDSSDLSEDEKTFKNFFNDNVHGRRYSGVDFTDINLYQEQSLDKYLKKICISDSTDNQKVNCIESGDQIECEKDSLFKVELSVKK